MKARVWGNEQQRVLERGASALRAEADGSRAGALLILIADELGALAGEFGAQVIDCGEDARLGAAQVGAG